METKKQKAFDALAFALGLWAIVYALFSIGGM